MIKPYGIRVNYGKLIELFDGEEEKLNLPAWACD